jgi:hypothetical protein
MKIKGTHVLMAYGPILVASFYATWLAGRISLGYWPRPSLDDPKGIIGFWMWTYDVTAFLSLVGLPVVGVLAAMSLFRPLRDGSPEWKGAQLRSIDLPPPAAGPEATGEECLPAPVA